MELVRPERSRDEEEAAPNLPNGITLNPNLAWCIIRNYAKSPNNETESAVSEDHQGPGESRSSRGVAAAERPGRELSTPGRWRSFEGRCLLRLHSRGRGNCRGNGIPPPDLARGGRVAQRNSKEGVDFLPTRRAGNTSICAATAGRTIGHLRMNLEYRHVDVFTSRPYSGNSLPVFVDPCGLSAEQMLRITRELRHFEAIFLQRMPEPDTVSARVFDLFEELPF